MILEHYRKWKKYMVPVLFSTILVLGIFYTVSVSYAATVTVGVVKTTGRNLNVRSGPGSEYSIIGTIGNGTKVTILSMEKNWYKIVFQTSEGYVAKEYITNIRSQEVADSYVDKFINQGFPRSYAEALNNLQKIYPNWTFEPVMTKLDWSTVIAQESKLGRNLVQSVNNDAQKSTAAGAYDWATNKWIGYDGGTWVCASPEMIAYCMDPRNFLNETNIFQFATNEYQEYQNAAGVNKLVKGSFMAENYLDTDGKWKSYADTFMTVGKSVGVSPYHLATRCLQEQGTKGNNNSISGKVKGYENYFNYFHIGAYPANGLSSVQNGLKYAKNQGWNTRYASILGGARSVGNDFIKKGQNTLYFEKFNVVNKAAGLYNHQYMTNVQSAMIEGQNMKKAYSDNTTTVVFRIPIYENMPQTACTLPKSGNPNNWMKSLKIEGYQMTPAFNAEKTQYSLTVEKDVSTVKITGEAVAATSKVTGTGTVKLEYGTNSVKIVCKAQNGSVREYVLNIVRKNPEKEMKKGDVNGDGKVTLVDLVAVKRHILKIETLKNKKKEAADVDANDQITLTDYAKIKRHILGYESLK